MRALLPPLAFLLVVRVVLCVLSAPIQRHVPALVVPQRPRGAGVPRWLAGWANWDGSWYLSLAERGYTYVPDGQSSTAFLPLYPLAIRALAELGLDPLVAGWIVANLAFLGAGCLLWHLTAEKFGTEAAGRTLVWLAVFPYAFFFGAVYAESLFLFGAVAAFWAAERGRLGLAGLLGGLSALARPTGIALFPALLLLAAGTGTRRPRDLLPLLWVPALPALFLAYLGWQFGSPWVFLASHRAGWHVEPGPHLVGALTDVTRVVGRGLKLHDPAILTVLLPPLLAVAFLALAVVVHRHLGAPYTAYTLTWLAITLLFVRDAVGRQLAVLFPVFMVAGVLDRGGLVAQGLRLASFALQLVLLAMFLTWRWVS